MTVPVKWYLWQMVKKRKGKRREKILHDCTRHFGTLACGPLERTDTAEVISWRHAKTLVMSLVFSCLDYCNSLLACISQKLVNRIQHVMNCAAHLVCKAPRGKHVSPHPVDLHWLPVECRLEYKIATICYSVITCAALVHPIALSAPLLIIAYFVFRTDANKFKAFAFIGPSIWNNLPFSVWCAQHLSSSKSLLKTHLRSVSYF